MVLIIGTLARADFTAELVTNRTGGLVPSKFTEAANGYVFFACVFGSTNIEPCYTKGPLATSAILEVVPDVSFGSDPAEFTRVGNLMFFVASHPSYGRELWVCDVTKVPLKATLVKDISSTFPSSNPHSLVECNGKLLFAANADNSTGQGDELWVSNGTATGTTLLKDIAPGAGDSEISKPTTINGIAYFSATSTGHGGGEVWRSDGTLAGTFMLADPRSGYFSYPQGFVLFNGEVYFFALNPGTTGYDLWKTNGQASGTVIVKQPITAGGADGGSTSPSTPIISNGLMIFRGASNAAGYELWRSDGTSAGTVMVKDIRAGSNSSGPFSMIKHGNFAYFVADDGSRGEQVWRTDGTENGTVIPAEVYNYGGNPAPRPHSLASLGGLVFFRMLKDGNGVANNWATGEEWWGLGASGPPIYFEMNAGAGNGFDTYDSDQLVVGNNLYFSAYPDGSNRQVLRITATLGVSLPPVSQLIAAGNQASFIVAPTEGMTATTQWQKNNANIIGATSNTYSIASAATTHAGTYRAVLSDGKSTAISSGAKLGVVNTLLPAVRTAMGGTIAVSVSAAAPTGTTLSYQWYRGATQLSNGVNTSGGVVSGATTAKLSITKATDSEEGAYTCVVGMDALSLTTQPADVKVVIKPIVTLGPVPASIVSGALNWQLAANEYPTGFIVGGLPSGLAYNGITGLITGIPNVSGSFKINVSAKNVAGTGLVQQFTLNISALTTGTEGNFTAWLSRRDQINHSLGGYVTLSVAATGSFTGTLKNGTASYPLKGRLVAPLSGHPTASLSLKRPAPLLPLGLTLDFDGANNAVSGSLVDPAIVGYAGAAVTGRRLIWSGSSALAYAALYNSTTDLPVASLNDTAQPLGVGWQQMTVSAAGAASGTGRTADGIAYTFSGSLWPEGSVPQFVLIYSGKGSVMGQPSIMLGATIPDNRITGWVDQFKSGPASTSDHTYATGIPYLQRTLDGAPWVKPTTLKPIVLGLSDVVGNASIAFAKGDVESSAQFSSLAQTFRINKNNTTSFAAATLAAGNPCKVAMIITPTTGLFSGSFTLIDTVAGKAVPRTVKYYGIMLSHRSKGYGYFLLPGLTPSTTTSPILGGRVVVN